MPYHLTAAELTLMAPGDCTACGAPSPTGRNSAGHCNACHNAAYHARRAARRDQRTAAMQAGRDYWAARGIAVGATVETFARDMLTGGLLGRMRIVGKAKVGICGAYVASGGKQYRADAFDAVADRKAVAQ